MAALLDLLQTTQVGAALAGLVLLLVVESLHPFFDFFREKKERGVHFARNLALGFGNSLLIAVVFAGLWVATAAWAEARGFGLLNVLAEVGLPGWAHALGAVLLLDAWTYAWHRMNHRVHHADAQMDVTTASRFHVGEITLSSALRIPIIALVGIYAWELVLYETLMFAVVQFHHANVALPPRLDRALRLVIVTPAMHKVHHSRWQPETDSNYSSMLSVWDRLFWSFRLRERLDEIHLGLDEFDAPEDHTIVGLLRMPLRPTHNPNEPTDAS